MPKYTIHETHNPTVIISLWDDLLKIPIYNTSYAETMANCLNGTYTVLLGSEDYAPKYFAVIQNIPALQTLYVIAVYAPGKVKAFMEVFCEWCKSRGFKSFTSISDANPEVYSRLMGMTKKYSVFHKEL